MHSFPTTIWTNLHQAGGGDAAALEEFAGAYRGPVARWLARRVGDGHRADDLCQEVFVRLLRGDVLARADRARGRFRSLLLTIASRVLTDSLRRSPREELALDAEARGAGPLELDPAELVERDADFDREWLEELVARALARLRGQSEGYCEVLEGHLAGESQSRQRLWIARGKLLSALKHEIALTCTSHGEVQAETDYLAGLLDSSGKI